MEKIIIDKEQYEQLLENDRFLKALLANGVDNWEGWDDSCSLRDDPLFQ